MSVLRGAFTRHRVACLAVCCDLCCPFSEAHPGGVVWHGADPPVVFDGASVRTAISSRHCLHARQTRVHTSMFSLLDFMSKKSFMFHCTGMVQLVARSTLTRYVAGSGPPQTEHVGFPLVLRDWVIKGLGSVQ